jgi:hypothetical protein
LVRLDSAKFVRDLKVEEFSLQVWRKTGFGYRLSDLDASSMVYWGGIEKKRPEKNVHASTEPMEGIDGRH